MYVVRPRSKFPWGPRAGLNGIRIARGMNGMRGVRGLGRFGDDAIFIPSGSIPPIDTNPDSSGDIQPPKIVFAPSQATQTALTQALTQDANAINANAANSATLTDRALWWLTDPSGGIKNVGGKVVPASTSIFGTTPNWIYVGGAALLLGAAAIAAGRRR